MSTVQTKEKIASILRVSSKSKPRSVAGAIVAALKEHDSVEMDAIGAGAVNQTVKAVAIAREFVDQRLNCEPSFTEVKIEGENKTGIKLVVQKM